MVQILNKAHNSTGNDRKGGMKLDYCRFFFLLLDEIDLHCGLLTEYNAANYVKHLPNLIYFHICYIFTGSFGQTQLTHIHTHTDNLY